MISVKEKIEKLIDLLNKELKYKSSNISEHKLTLTFNEDKTIILDFNQDYIRDLKKENINTMIKNYNLVNLILNNDGKTIIINENHATIIE